MRRDEHPVDINPDKETAERQSLHKLPGSQADTETASAYANRTGQRDTTSLRAGDAGRRSGAASGDVAHASGAQVPEGSDDEGTIITPADHPLREGL